MGLFILARKLTQRGIKIVGFHGVSLTDEEERFTTLFISPETFRRRLAHLQKHFRIISLDEAVTQLASDSIQPNQMVLTFDDGYYNFAARAAPILREFNATATVYLVSHGMVSQEPTPPLIIRDIILQTRCDQFSCTVPGIEASQPLLTSKDKAKFTHLALNHLKTLPLSGVEPIAYARHLAETLEVDFNELWDRRVWHCLNCDEVRGLSEEGFSMQVHGHLHRNVIDFPEVVEEEVSTCKSLVERATGKEARDYCYPGGLWNHQTWGALKRANIRSAVTTHYGPNFSKTPLLGLRRHLTGEDEAQLEFEFEMSGLRWLVHLLFHPSRLYEPSEKLQPYAESGKLF